MNYHPCPVLGGHYTLSLDALVTNPRQRTLYLEIDSAHVFLDWLGRDSARALLIRGDWCVRVFRHQLLSYVDYLARRRRLTSRNVGIEVLDCTIQGQDAPFVQECERMYFTGSGPTAHSKAEFYVLARRSVGSSWLDIVSQDRSFERIPMANVYFSSDYPRTGAVDLPAQFDFARDFDIHNQLARVVQNRLDGTECGSTILDAIIALRDHIRVTSGLTTVDGRHLMEQAFRQDGHHLRVNSLASASENDEQRGFRDFYCAVMTALRNPLAHEGPNGPFAASRYPNKRTVFKYLSFLSILFERAERPL